MTIHPPKLTIDPAKPFKDALFGREEFGNSLVSILRNVSDSLVIFVNAPWGAGKSTFAQMWLAHLREQQKLEVVYYDAYAVDYFDDPFVSFSGEIFELAKRLGGETAVIGREEFKKSAVQVGKQFIGLAAKVGIRAASLGAIESANIDEFKTIAAELATGVSEIGSNFIEKKIENYTAEKDALIDFKKKLAKLAAKIREQQGFPLTIIVDELDRCRPDFALSLLERIKHLFDVEGVAFVLLVNREQIENYIRAVYGEKVDARSYLLKFGNLFVELPDKRTSFAHHYISGSRDYCESLVVHYGFSGRVRTAGTFASSTGALADHFELTLREIEKVFAVMAIYYGSAPTSYYSTPLLISLLSILKIKEPVLFKNLANRTTSATDFFKGSRLKEIEISGRNRHDWSVLMDVLDLCLMSKDELERGIAQLNEHGGGRDGLRSLNEDWGGQRKNILPELCWHLDRFSLKPK